MIVDGEFVDTYEAEKLSDGTIEMIAGAVMAEYPEGTQITIDVTINPPRERK